MKPAYIIVIGGVITLLGTAISIYGAYREGIESSEQTNRIEDTLNRETKKLSYPLPSELYLTGLHIKIKSSAFDEHMPEIREQLKINDRSEEEILRYTAHGHQLYYGKYNKDIQESFNNKTLQVSFSVGEEPYSIEESYKATFFWKFSDSLSLVDNKTYLKYNIENRGDREESFLLSVNTRDDQKNPKKGDLRIFKGINSLLDICDKKVWIILDIGQNFNLRAPNSTIQFISFRDNYSRDYTIDIVGQKTVELDFMQKIYPDRKFPKSEFTYLEGVLKCKSMTEM